LRPTTVESLPDEVVKSRSASAAVADALREAIVHGTLEAGERLRQDAIATRYRVSQTIVREAFKQLTAEGFLTAEPRSGVTIASLTPDEAMEITQLRSLVEAQALAWAIPNMTSADLEAGARILAELDRAKSTDRIIALNARFHRALYAAARRERTLSIVAVRTRSSGRALRFLRKAINFSANVWPYCSRPAVLGGRWRK
jgi:DNA-binding GntR family transcriptional regulator